MEEDWRTGLNMRVLVIIAVSFALLGGVIVFAVPFTINQIDKKHNPIGEWTCFVTNRNVLETYKLIFDKDIFVQTKTVNDVITETYTGTYKRTFTREYTLTYLAKNSVDILEKETTICQFKKDYKTMEDYFKGRVYTKNKL